MKSKRLVCFFSICARKRKPAEGASFFHNLKTKSLFFVAQKLRFNSFVRLFGLGFWIDDASRNACWFVFSQFVRESANQLLEGASYFHNLKTKNLFLWRKYEVRFLDASWFGFGLMMQFVVKLVCFF